MLVLYQGSSWTWTHTSASKSNSTIIKSSDKNFNNTLTVYRCRNRHRTSWPCVNVAQGKRKTLQTWKKITIIGNLLLINISSMFVRLTPRRWIYSHHGAQYSDWVCLLWNRYHETCPKVVDLTHCPIIRHETAYKSLWKARLTQDLWWYDQPQIPLGSSHSCRLLGGSEVQNGCDDAYQPQQK